MQSINKQINFWRKSAERDFQTALGLFKIKRYDACLFFCHLCLEKVLKGLVVKRVKKAAPFVHDLERLAVLAKLELDDNQLKDLRVITGFNVSARYDVVKDSFYKKCNRNYVNKYLNITKDLHLCLVKKYR